MCVCEREAETKRERGRVGKKERVSLAAVAAYLLSQA